MKLATLLAQYLYSQKRLDLEGIGSFYLDPNAVVDSETSRQQKVIAADGIRFENDPSVKLSADLIQFISLQTGKMKALATADLSSHLELMQQFLNIGKPFQLEGIGNIVKIKPGKCEFTAGTLLEKVKENHENDAATALSKTDYQPFLEKEKIKINWQKPVLALLVIFGIGLAVLGGYIINKRNSRPSVSSRSNVVDAPQPVPAETNNAVLVDSSNINSATVNNDGNYKFVLETAGKSRAFERFNKLKKYQWDVKMETADSMHYKLFLVLPSLSIDTSRVVDSLTALNGKKVYVESN